MRRKLAVVAGAAAVALALAACSATPAEPEGPTGSGEITIGALTSLSGANSVTGTQWLAGFHAGFDYLTDGTGVLNGTTITIKDVDDASDPNVALTEATSLVTDGVQIITGTQSSAIAIGLADFAKENQILFVSGSANSDALTAANKYTFRSTRQAAIDVATIVAGLGDNLKGAKVVLLAHDIEYGKGLIAQFKAVAGDKVGSIVEVLAPFPTPDVAPYIQRVIDEKPDILIPFWSGDTTPLYTGLAQQNVIADTAHVITNTGVRSSWPIYQQIAADSLQVFTPYPPGALDNEPAKFLDNAVKDTDYTAADGFNAALMIGHAITESGGESDVDGWIKAIEGYTFDGPRGSTTIRASDHAMLAPMYLVSYASGKPEVLQELSGDEVAPPVVAMRG